MEIFTNEFREELFDNLESIVIEYKNDTPFKKTIELNNKIQLAFEKEKEIFNSKKKKNKKFKVGDTVYWGERKGVVTEQHNDKDEASTFVCFEENGEFRRWEISFTKDGRFLLGTPIVLSHFPYELKMKKIK